MIDYAVMLLHVFLFLFLCWHAVFALRWFIVTLCAYVYHRSRQTHTVLFSSAVIAGLWCFAVCIAAYHAHGLMMKQLA